jgi:hypothetical protein
MSIDECFSYVNQASGTLPVSSKGPLDPRFGIFQRKIIIFNLGFHHISGEGLAAPLILESGSPNFCDTTVAVWTWDSPEIFIFIFLFFYFFYFYFYFF